MNSQRTAGTRSEHTSFEERLKLLALWGGIAYAFGFACILVQTSRYGIQVIEVIKPLNFWVGLPPTLMIFLSIYVWDRHLSEIVRRVEHRRRDLLDKAAPPLASPITRLWKMASAAPRRLGINVKYEVKEESARALVKFVINALVVFIAVIPQLIKAIDPIQLFRWLGSIGSVAFVIIESVAALVVLVFAVDWARHLFETHARLRLTFLSSLVVAFILYYVWLVYPMVPQELGGGWPAKVQFILAAETFQDSTLEQRGLISINGTTGNTGDVCLLYSAADVYFVDFHCSVESRRDEPLVISVPNNLVRAVIWKGRPKYPDTPWFIQVFS